MASKAVLSIVLFLVFNLLFFTSVSSFTHKYRTTPANRNKCAERNPKFGACIKLLFFPKPIVLGTPPYTPCCSLVNGVADFEAAVCLCNAIRGGVAGIRPRAPVDLGFLLDKCGRRTPSGFKCR